MAKKVYVVVHRDIDIGKGLTGGYNEPIGVFSSRELALAFIAKMVKRQVATEPEPLADSWDMEGYQWVWQAESGTWWITSYIIFEATYIGD